MTDLSTKAGCTAMREELRVVLQKFCEERGLDLSFSGGTMLEDGCMLKIDFRKSAASSEMQAKAKSTYEAYAPMLGMPADAFGKKVVVNGRIFSIVGLDFAKPKNCVQLKREGDGKMFKCPPQTAINGLRHA